MTKESKVRKHVHLTEEGWEMLAKIAARRFPEASYRTSLMLERLVREAYEREEK